MKYLLLMYLMQGKAVLVKTDTPMTANNCQYAKMLAQAKYPDSSFVCVAVVDA